MNLVGKNSLTVFLSISEDKNLKMFFCPYTQSNVVQYTGQVQVIYPSYDPDQCPNVIIRPQKLSRNIHYVFSGTEDRDIDTTSFYIQNRLFESSPVSTYHCFNCQAPQLYFGQGKAVYYDSKRELKKAEDFVCPNPHCHAKLRYLGIVDVGMPTNTLQKGYN